MQDYILLHSLPEDFETVGRAFPKQGNLFPFFSSGQQQERISRAVKDYSMSQDNNGEF